MRRLLVLFFGMIPLLTGCITMKNAEELRADPAASFRFESDKSPSQAAASIEAWMKKCYVGATYSHVGTQTSRTDVEREEYPEMTTISTVMYGAFGALASYSAEIRPRGASGSSVVVHSLSPAWERRAPLAQLWVDDGYLQCKLPKR